MGKPSCGGIPTKAALAVLISIPSKMAQSPIPEAMFFIKAAVHNVKIL